MVTYALQHNIFFTGSFRFMLMPIGALAFVVAGIANMLGAVAGLAGVVGSMMLPMPGLACVVMNRLRASRSVLAMVARTLSKDQ